MDHKLLKRFRTVAIWEGISFILLLGIAMPLKYGLDIPQAVSVVGMAHGILFILYILCLIQVTLEFSWKIKKVLLALLAAFIPFGPFIFDKKLFSEEK